MNLSFKIFIALILAIIVGLFTGHEYVPFFNAWVAPIGTMFISLIKMIIVPVVLSSLIVGVTSLGDTKKLGRIGIKVILLYLITTAFALVIALIIASLVHPGSGLELAAAKAPTVKQSPGFMAVLVNMIPTNPIMSMAKADMLPIIIFALFVGTAITAVGEKANTLLSFFDGLAEVSYKIIGMVMEVAPIGVFALLVPVVAANGPKVLLPLLSVIACIYVSCIIHAIVVYANIVRFVGKFSPIKFFKGMTEAMLIAFTTCSSAAALTINMKNCQEKLGVKKEICSFTLPLGATINMDGTAIYQGVCAVFIATVYGIHLTMPQMVMIVLTGTLASIGTAGVPGAGLIMLALVLQTVGLPMEGLALVAGIDRILDMSRTCLNITGDAAMTVAIDYSERNHN
ncbi:dicarboxylate/amino acid:cation symporter [Pectinatus brassicae]|uniref:Na+/H+-dicarboxylate symporter n=1 Tax=Pectinatus brassicae TaxID=862415 RepID=A0A840UIK5_9FIRM|nr:dicarboxylate/amino acid:cation symporter [Pectinatus brassicae]MBB5336946.1 Na+/H+-dicarboxylate symporter [Pectinatus brassicae]